MRPLILKLQRWQLTIIVAGIVVLGVVIFLSWPKTANPPESAEPSATFKAATQAMKGGKPRDAIELFTQVIAAQPNNDAAYVNRAACYEALEEHEPMLKRHWKSTRGT